MQEFAEQRRARRSRKPKAPPAQTRRYDAAVSEIDYHKDQESIVLIGKADTYTRTTGKVMDQHQRDTSWLILGV